MWEKMGRELRKGARAVRWGCEPDSEGGREREGKLGRSILDLHAVKGKFSKAVRKSLSQNQPSE